MINLNKTEQALIERAKHHGGRAGVDCGSGRGSLGGRVSFGSREAAALSKLADAGLVKIVSTIKDIDYNNGYGIHTTTFSFQLVSA